MRACSGRGPGAGRAIRVQDFPQPRAILGNLLPPSPGFRYRRVPLTFGTILLAAAAAEPLSAQTQFLPDRALFEPLVADMKEPSFYGGVRRVNFSGPATPSSGQKTMEAGVTGFGRTFELWEICWNDVCDGLQVGGFAGVFSQFNLSVRTADLNVERRSLSYEAIDALLALDVGVGPFDGRVYGGSQYIFSTTLGLDRRLVQWGGELRSPSLRTGAAGSQADVVGLAAADFRSFEQHGWRTTSSLKTGFESRTAGGGASVRLLAVYLDGFMPFGQFFTDTRMQNLGGEIQLHF